MGLRGVAVATLLAAATLGCSALWVRGTLATQSELTLVAQFAFSGSTESVGLHMHAHTLRHSSLCVSPVLPFTWLLLLLLQLLLLL